MNDLEYNEDGSVTFYVGSKNTEGHKNFIKTVAGKGWFSLFRFYGPDQVFLIERIWLVILKK